MISYTCISNEYFRAPLWASEQFSEAQAYLDLLTCAEFGRRTRYSTSKKRFDLERGQRFTAKNYLVKKWRVGRDKLEKWFLKWEREGRASVVCHGKHGIVITLHDYDKWVIDQHTDKEEDGQEAHSAPPTCPASPGDLQTMADETPVPADKVYKEYKEPRTLKVSKESPNGGNTNPLREQPVVDLALDRKSSDAAPTREQKDAMERKNFLELSEIHGGLGIRSPKWKHSEPKQIWED